MVKDTSGLRWFYCLPQRTDISQVKGVGAFLCVGKRKQLGSLKFFLSHPSNHLRGCLSRYTESINDSNSCLSTEEHCGSSAAEDQPLQSEQDTLCCSFVCRVKPSRLQPSAESLRDGPSALVTVQEPLGAPSLLQMVVG